ELGPSSAMVSRATSAAMSLMCSRSRASSTRSDAEVDSASRLSAATSCCRRERSSLSWAGWALGRVPSAPGAPARFALAVSGRCDRGDLAAHLAQRAFALGQRAALLGEPRLEVLQAPAQDLGVGGLRHQRALKLGHPRAETFDPAALLGEFGGRHVG